MINRKFTSDDLKGLYCKPLRNIQNRKGDTITPDDIVEIEGAWNGVNVYLRQDGKIIVYIRRIMRESLELTNESLEQAIIRRKSRINAKCPK